MFLINLNAEVVACIFIIQNRARSQIWKILPNMVFPRFGGKKWRRCEHAHASYPGLFFRPPRVQPPYEAGRKESSGTGLITDSPVIAITREALSRVYTRPVCHMISRSLLFKQEITSYVTVTTPRKCLFSSESIQKLLFVFHTVKIGNSSVPDNCQFSEVLQTGPGCSIKLPSD